MGSRRVIPWALVPTVGGLFYGPLLGIWFVEGMYGSPEVRGPCNFPWR